MLHPFAPPPFNLYPQKKSRPFLKNIRPFFNEPSRNFHEALPFFIFGVEWGSWKALWSYENRDVVNYLVLVKKVM